MMVAEAGISEQVMRLMPSNCGKEFQECNEKFWDQDCVKYCKELSYTKGVCILYEGLIPPKAPKYRCCCT